MDSPITTCFQCKIFFLTNTSFLWVPPYWSHNYYLQWIFDPCFRDSFLLFLWAPPYNNKNLLSMNIDHLRLINISFWWVLAKLASPSLLKLSGVKYQGYTNKLGWQRVPCVYVGWFEFHGCLLFPKQDRGLWNEYTCRALPLLYMLQYIAWKMLYYTCI